ncbi:MAG: hypothetical protein P1U70_25900, partial [Saprospiraceae bacterium]|nr:hypothetical protein [Saprospiraceae bacterium]
MKKYFLIFTVCLFQVIINAQWSQIGSAVSTLSLNTDIVVTGDTTYVAYRDIINSNKLNVKLFNGTSWTFVGAPNFSASGIGGVSMKFDSNGDLHVAYFENSTNNVNVQKFNGSSWVAVGAANFATGGSISLDFDGLTPFVAFSEATGGGMSVMDFDGTNWGYVGSSSFSASGSNFASLVIDNSTPYVAFQDFGNGSKVTVMSFSGGNWSNVGSAGFSAGTSQYVSLAFDGSTPYVAYKDGGNASKASVMSFSGGNWSNVGSAGFSGGIVEYTKLAFRNSIPYLVYSDDSSSDAARVDFFNGNSWVQLGGNMDSQTSFNSIAIDADTVYVSYINGANSFSVIAQEYVIQPLVCSISASGLSNIQCNNNGTPSD